MKTYPESIVTLMRAGIAEDDAWELRRIAMTLHRWHELECGDANGHAVERDETTGKPYLTYERSNGPRDRTPIADREAGALKRLGKIMTKYPTLRAYQQGDPRGAALYILRPGDVPDGAEVDSYYDRGLAVYK